MLNFIQIILIVCVFFGVVFAGIWLTRATKEELKEGKKWFRLAIKLCLLFLWVFFIYWIVSGFAEEVLIVVLSLVAFLVIIIISWKKSE